MSTDKQGRSLPRSMRHRRILDVAEQNPSASITDIAAQVTSATPELVEQVLEEHGDPASRSESSPEDAGTASASASPDEGNNTTDTERDEQSETTGDPPANATASEERTAADEDPATAEHDDDERTTDDAESDATVVSDDDTAEDGDDAETEPDRPHSLEALSEKQRALLEAVATQPEATQAELAEEFDVTRATISRWANDIPGFEWRTRESFVDAVVDDTNTTDMSDQPASDSDTPDNPQSATAAGDEAPDTAVAEIETDLEALADRVAALEGADTDAEQPHDPVFEDPELVHKIAHACLTSDRISESEELRILKGLLA